jgi:methionine-S-sulfoxide reductase
MKQKLWIILVEKPVRIFAIVYLVLSAVYIWAGLSVGPGVSKMESKPGTIEKATFAGGCFWCMEGPFDALNGVISTTSGYTGGKVKNPSYKEVTTGTTGHAESVQVLFDPSVISYADLLKVFWRNIDPTMENGQFGDRGSHYRTAIFYHNEDQKLAAEKSKKQLIASGKFQKPIQTEISSATEFYPAEDYHQDYYLKNPVHYKLYRKGSGREDFLKRTWDEAEEIL